MNLKANVYKQAVLFFVAALLIIVSTVGYGQADEELLPGHTRVTLSVENIT